MSSNPSNRSRVSTSPVPLPGTVQTASETSTRLQKTTQYLRAVRTSAATRPYPVTFGKGRATIGSECRLDGRTKLSSAKITATTREFPFPPLLLPLPPTFSLLLLLLPQPRKDLSLTPLSLEDKKTRPTGFRWHYSPTTLG